MRFDYLHLEAFGHFTDFTLQFDTSKNFHLLYGPNETGKSTILRAVAHYLYGFPQQTDDSFLHDNQKLRIGGQLSNHRGETLEFVRRKGRKNTALTLDNQPIDEVKIQSFLNGLQEQQFLNMFALDHIRLREGGDSLLQSDGNVGESLFAAASGISVLRNVLEQLDKASRELYLKGGSRPKMNEALRKEKELTKFINENQLKVQEWKQLERAYKNGATEIAEIKKQLQQHNMNLTKYNRIKQTLPIIALRTELRQQLKELANIPDLGEQVGELRKENIRMKESAQAQQNEAKNKLNEIEQQLAQLSIPERLLDQEALIEGLNREVETYRHNRERLPQLQGAKRQSEQRVLSTLKEIDPENRAITDVENYRISAEEKKTIVHLANKHPLLDQEKNSTKDNVEKIEKELKRQRQLLDELGEIVEVTNLAEAVDRAKANGNIEQQLENTKQEIAQLEREITLAIRRLPLWDGSSESFVELAVPTLKNTIQKYNKEQNELSNKQKQLEQQLENERQTIDTNEARILELESVAKIPTEQQLDDLRQHRHDGWLVIRNKLNEQPVQDDKVMAFTKGLPLDLAFEKSMNEADDTADVMRREAEKVGEKNKLIADIKKSEAKIAELTEQLNDVENLLTDWQERWRAEWSVAKIEPLSPEEMLEWLDYYEAIIQLIAHKEKLVQEAALLTDKRDQYIASLRAALAHFAPLAEQVTLRELITEAETTIKNAVDKNTEIVHIQRTIDDATAKLEEASAKKQTAKDKLTEWEIQWQKAVDPFPFATNRSLKVVIDLIELYDRAVHDYESLKEVEAEINVTEKEIELFTEKVHELEHTLGTSTDEQSVDITVTHVYDTLKKAKADVVKRDNLREQKEQWERAKLATTEKITAVNAVLNDLMQQAGCTTLDELEKMEQAYDEKKSLSAKIAEREEQLIQLGNGLSLEQLLAEAKNVDKDSLDYTIEEIEQAISELDRTRSESEQKHGVIKNEFNEKIKGTNDASLRATEEKESILANLAQLTNEYVNHKLATLLLKRGIDYYREQNESPILKRASEVFSQLTEHSFDKIDVDFDDKDNAVIVGVRNGNEIVHLSGMSDGTTDQLYLALRIASIEKYIAENGPIPFIVDDILIHFDDDRAKETLKALLHLSEKTQIIFFTHHLRLIELMNEVASEAAYQTMIFQEEKTGVLN